MQFRIEEETIFIRKIPLKNTIEVRASGKVILYDRSDGTPRKLGKETVPNEHKIMDLINQYFVPQHAHNRYRESYKERAT